MPSLFSWRPKIQVKLKKLSHQLGDSRTMSISSDGTTSGGMCSPSSEDYIVESSPPLNSVLTEDEYFYGPNRNLDRGRESPTKGHRVRFEEGVNNNKPPPSNHQPPPPPVCNVIPNRGGGTVPAILLNNQGMTNAHPTSSATARHEYFSCSPTNHPSPKWPSVKQRCTDPTTETAGMYIESGQQHLRENHQPPRPARYGQKQSLGHNRANQLLQQLRSEEVHSESESNVSLNEQSVYNSRLPPSPRPVTVATSVLYLQFHDEIKRSLLPLNLHSMEQLKSLFLRSFPNLSMHYMNQPQIKIYIQDKNSKSQLFYELEDIKEVQNGSILKLRDHHQQHLRQGFQTPPPIRFIDHLPPSSSEYMSEPEFSRPSSHQPALPSTYQPTLRPASVVPTTNHRPELDYHRNTGQKPAAGAAGKPGSLTYRQPSPTYDPYYYDPYYASDSSSQCRSGSTTPVQIDSETRERMDTMERQLAGLSSLVHSALISKGMNPTAQREMMQLRKQIMDLQQPSYEAMEKEAQAKPKDTRKTMTAGVGVNQPLLNNIYKETRKTQAELKQLKRLAQVNAQASQDLLNEAAIKVRRELRNTGLQQLPNNILAKKEVEVGKEVEQIQTQHLEQLVDVQNSLRLFESSMEQIRSSVLNSNRKLRMTEVEQLTNALTQIGKNAARLKTEFPQLQMEIEKEIRENMENIVKQENYLKEEGQQVDNCLRRCKTLAGMMVTMKKLAMVQDPALKLQYKNKGDSTNKRLLTKLTGIATAIHNNASNSTSDPDLKERTPPSKAVGQMLAINSPHVLDSILDELNSSKPKDIVDPATAALRSAPKPPERKRYNTTEAIQIYFNENGSSIPPNPIRQTNALDITSNSDNISRITVASAASTESVNSQEGIKDRLPFISAGGRKVA